MKRELKFRDFDLISKTFQYFTLDTFDKDKHDIYGNTTQYTGMKDVKGVEIYEGDFVVDEEQNRFEIAWSADSCQFLAKPVGAYDFMNGEVADETWCTVIGNIFNKIW